jgi:type II secretory pathway component PulK
MARAGSKRHGRQGERGIALILTLMVLSILLILVTQFAWSAKVEHTIARNAKDELKMYMAARGAIPLLEAYLRSQRSMQTGVDSSRDTWADPSTFSSIQVGGQEGGGGAIVTLHVDVADCERFLNVNLLQDPNSRDWATGVMQRLAEHLQIDGADELVAKVVEYCSGQKANMLAPGNGTSQPSNGTGSTTGQQTPQLGMQQQGLQQTGMLADANARTTPVTFADELLGIPDLTPQMILGLLGTPENVQTKEPAKVGLLNYLTTKGSKKLNLNTMDDNMLWAVLPDADSSGAAINRDDAVSAIDAWHSGSDASATGTSGTTGMTGTTGTKSTSSSASSSTQNPNDPNAKPGQDFKTVNDLLQIQGLSKVFAAQTGGGAAQTGGTPVTGSNAATQAQKASLRNMLAVSATCFRLTIDASRAGLSKRYEAVIMRGNTEFSTLQWREVPLPPGALPGTQTQ